MERVAKGRLTLLLSALTLGGVLMLSAGTASAQSYSNCARDSGNICFKADDFFFNAGTGVTTKKARFTMQTDGNLVLYDETGRVRWASNSNGNPGAHAVFQEDGNLVVYQGQRVLFASNTDHRGAYLVVQVDGNVVIYDHEDRPIWATQSGH